MRGLFKCRNCKATEERTFKVQRYVTHLESLTRDYAGKLISAHLELLDLKHKLGQYEKRIEELTHDEM